MGFHVIAGSGHCGTMWLARVLNSVPGQCWYHELRSAVKRAPWQTLDRFHPTDSTFDAYWAQIRVDLARYDTVGDSNSWPPEDLIGVNHVVPIDRVIYLTRDKDKQLYSLLNHSPVWQQRPEHWPDVAHGRLNLYAEISGEPRDIRLLVEANDFMPDALREKGLTVDVYSLEELTTDIDKLRELAPLTDAELQAWQLRDINRKVPA